MKIQLASDLHLEFLEDRWPGERVVEPAPGADVLILAGDISLGASALEKFADWPVPVLYVAGNHEFYHREMAEVRTDLTKASGSARCLENESVEIGGVRFLGATLWTDYQLDQSMRPDQAMAHASRSMTDHKVIRVDGKRFFPFQALKLHEASRAWLESELSKPFSGKTVVITHHGPHPKSIHPVYAGDERNPAYVSDMGDLLQGADLWVHGHVHSSFDYQVGRCRVVANPLGYPLVRGKKAKKFADVEFENQEFRQSMFLEI